MLFRLWITFYLPPNLFYDGIIVAISNYQFIAVGTNSNHVLIRGSWIVLDGFEITGGNAINKSKGVSNITFANNYIHHMKTQGIVFGEATDVLIQDNVLDFNGNGRGDLFCSATGHDTPAGCHAIYVNAHATDADPVAITANITIRRNVISNSGGAGVQVRTDKRQCTVPCTVANNNGLVENNLFLNNYHGVNLPNSSVNNWVFRNNTFVVTAIPNDIDTEPTHVSFFAARDVVFRNNIFYSNASSYNGIPFKVVKHATSGVNEDMNYNLWFNVATAWLWDGINRTDFNGTWKSVTGDGANDILGSNPLFQSASNLQLQSSSPARNAGTNTQCALTDKNGVIRPQPTGGICDIGAYEYNP